MRRLVPGAFFGETVAALRVAGFTFTESVHAANQRTGTHVHENPFFYLILQGMCSEENGDSPRVSGPDTLVFHPSGARHANHWHAPGGRCFHIEVSAVATSRCVVKGPVLERPFQSRGLTATLAAKLFHEFTRDDDIAPLAMEGLALELVAEGGRAAPDSRRDAPPWLIRVRDRLHDDFARTPSLHELGQEAGVHSAHLARTFRRYYGYTIGSYLRRVRTEFLCRQLATTDRSLAELALAAGYADHSHLCKNFKRVTGTSPSRFRQQTRNFPTTW